MLASIPDNGDKAEWHRAVSDVNGTMAESLASLRSDLRRQLARNRHQQVAQGVLASREHPFCVFPLEHLTETYDRILSESQ